MSDAYQQFFKKAQRAAVESGSAHPSAKLKKQNLGKNGRDQEASAKIKYNFNLDDHFSSETSVEAAKNRRSASGQKEMVNELRRRLKKKRARLRQPLNFRVMFLACVGLSFSGLALWKADLVEQYSKRLEISFMSYAGAEDKPPAKDTQPAAPAEDKTPKAETAATAKTEFSEEDINHFAKLNERQHELDAREQELNRLEQELAQQKTELEKRLKDLEGTRRQISSVLEEKVKTDDKKVDSLVQVYSNMKPQQAAKIFETMDEDLAIEILGRMKKKPAAEILNLVKAEKAQVLSEKYAGYQRP